MTCEIVPGIAALIVTALTKGGQRRCSAAYVPWVGESAELTLETSKPKLETVLMRAVVQRVSRARVTVDGQTTGEIGPGLLVLLGVAQTDTEADADYLVDKIAGLRVFEDADGKMNLSVAGVGGAVLAVSQFTLYGDVRRGKRPSFDAAARPEQANSLYEYFVAKVRATGVRCETGIFQAMMNVELVNNGPVTIMLDSTKLF